MRNTLERVGDSPPHDSFASVQISAVSHDKPAGPTLPSSNTPSEATALDNSETINPDDRAAAVTAESIKEAERIVDGQAVSSESISDEPSERERIESERLLPLVYAELKRLAAYHLSNETPGNTLQPTALVHEAYMRLVANPDVRWDSRGHFFAAAARSMRQILINRARRRQATRHGGGRAREVLQEDALTTEPTPERLLALNDALEELEKKDPRKARLVELRYFAGLTIDETANVLEVSTATVKREWQFSRTWLHREMSEG